MVDEAPKASFRLYDPQRPGVMTLSVLEACPFAHEVILGVVVIPHDMFGSYQVMCGDCNAFGPPSLSKDEARILWNDRRK